MTVETIKTRHRGKKQNQQQIHETISNNIYSRKIIIFYVENPKRKESTKKLIELKSELSKMADYKVDLQN